MIGRIHHVGLRVADVAEASARWQRLLGLSALDGDPALLRCAYEDLAVALAPGEPAGVDYVAYELRRGIALADAEAALRERGAEVVRLTVPVRGEALRLTDPDGNGVVVVEHVPDPDPRPDVCKRSDTLPGFHPRRLQHVNYLTADTPRLVDWYVEVLGFAVTDWIGDGACWLHVDREHHVLAILDKGYPHIHHVAFELVDWGDFRVAFDHLAAHGRPIVWGPGRHGMAQNLFSYWRMVEEEVFIELFTDMEQLGPDHEPRRFPDDAFASNTWGQLPPRSYFRFDEDAIRAEWEQSQQLGVPLA
jgi:catechol 2,3-dioxygenase-like lactoylglutathione lyase family enzyme